MACFYALRKSALATTAEKSLMDRNAPETIIAKRVSRGYVFFAIYAQRRKDEVHDPFDVHNCPLLIVEECSAVGNGITTRYTEGIFLWHLLEACYAR